MNKNPFDVLKQLGKDQLSRDKELIEFAHKETDGLITWLIGIAVTALSLIVANYGSIQTNLKNSSKPIVLYLFLTIILGVAYRYVACLVVIFHKKLEDYFSGIFSESDMTPIKADPDIENADFNAMIIKLKNDFTKQYPSQDF